jgi:hypothetical protein
VNMLSKDYDYCYSLEDNKNLLICYDLLENYVDIVRILIK